MTILDENEKNALEQKLSNSDITTALKTMKHNKSPDTSGFTVEFYKFFWKDVGHLLLESLNYGFRLGKLSISQREGTIILMPKQNIPKQCIENWRPITLLNVAYKIAAGAFAKRPTSFLLKLINEDQSGFMAERFTGDNIRMVYDTLYHAKEKENQGILLLVDFKKHFILSLGAF